MPTTGIVVAGVAHYGPPSAAPQPQTRFASWIGLTLHPSIGATSFFGSLAVELEWMDHEVATRGWYAMPMLRLGVASLGRCWDQEQLNVWLVMMPCTSAAMVFGARPGWPGESPIARVGMSFNLFSPLVLPNLWELIFERDLEGRTTSMIRLGVGF